MDKIPISREAIILDEAEHKKLKACLDYCFHRLSRHEHSGLHGIVDINFIDYIRKNI